MVAISLSGSGEEPGWATSRPTLQRLFHQTAFSTSPVHQPGAVPPGRPPAGASPRKPQGDGLLKRAAAGVRPPSSAGIA
jgi:hypothetical protein